MFYYYGRKKQIAKHYPAPNYPAIVEPFAGSAAYSLYGNNWKKDVILVEKDEKVADIWQWLITEATRDRDFRGYKNYCTNPVAGILGFLELF